MTPSVRDLLDGVWAQPAMSDRASAERRRTERISHADGTIAQRRSDGNDPYPPAG